VELGLADIKRHRSPRLGPYFSIRRLRFAFDGPGARLLVEQFMQFLIAAGEGGVGQRLRIG
jgi:hypothetical protein